MFQKLSITLNVIVLLTSLLVVMDAMAQENKDIDQFQQSIMKQNHHNVKVTNIQYFPTLKKSSKVLTKDNIVVPSFIIDEEAFCDTLNLKKTTTLKPNTLYSQQNNPYLNATSPSNYLNNRDRIRLERLDKVNTLKKSLGKTQYCPDNFPIYKDPNDTMFLKIDPTNKSFTIDPSGLIRLLDPEEP